MRAKAIAKLGFGYDDVAAINPAIIYTNCYGYGRRGPDRDRPAYDDTIQAECGLPAVQQQLTGEADYVGTIMADKVAGLTALYATTMALFHRERTGEGQEVEVAMFETMASFMLVEHANGALFDPPLGPAVYPRTVAPNRRPYRTSDGHIAALIYNDKHWNAFINAVRPPWASELYSTLEQRARQIDTVYGLVAETMKQRSTQEWLALFARTRDTGRATATRPASLFDDPHLNAVGMFETVDTPHGPVRFPGVPTWFSRTPGRVAGPAPELGADTAEVLAEIGTSQTQNRPKWPARKRFCDCSRSKGVLTMAVPVYKRILDLFEAEGVKTLFGIPDPNFVHMFLEADSRGWSVVSPHHEESAGFMAEAVSRMTGKPGLCIGTLGPGVANIAGAMMCAKVENSPVIFLGGQRARITERRVRRGRIQFVRQEALFAPTVKYSASIEYADQTDEIIREAIRRAMSTRPARPTSSFRPT